MGSRTRAQWILTVTALATLTAAALTATPSSADTGGLVEQRLTPQESVVVDDAAHDWNTNAPEQHKVLTHGKFQYTVYWDDDTRLVLVRRHLKTGDVQRLVFPDQLSEPGDPHRATTLGMSLQDGTLHLSYDHHNNRINYRRSVDDFLTSPPDELALEQFRPKESMLDDPSLDNRATYPRFFTGGHGELYFVFRQGGSGNGDTILRRYDATNGTWRQLGTVISRTGTYPEWDDSTSRNAYINGIDFDSNDRLHLSWIFRETAATPRSNHDIHYAYSDDHGVTWYNNDGDQIADLAEGDPISLDDPGIVAVPVPVDAGLRGQTGMAFDSRNQPHILSIRSTVVSADRSKWNLHYVHYWRSPDGNWHGNYIDNTDVDIVKPVRRGDILLDKHDNVHVYFAHGDDLVAARGTASSGWRYWTFYDRLTDDAIPPLPAAQGMHYDRTLFEREGIVSMPMETVSGTGTGFTLNDFAIEPVMVEDPAEAPSAPTLRIRLNEAREANQGEVQPGDLGFVLDWEMVDGAAAYDIFRKREGSDSYELIVDDFGAGSFVTDYLDTDIEPETTYTYHVRAVNRFGRSEPSNTIRAVVEDRSRWSDYTVEFDMGDISWTTSLTFRIQDVCNLYSWHVRTGGEENGVRPVRIADCAQTRLAPDMTVPFEIEHDQTYHFRFEVVGDSITTRIDDQLIGTVTDDALGSGLIGYRSALRSDAVAAVIDNIRVVDTSGDVLLTEDFSSGNNPFQAQGPRACGDVRNGALVMGRGDWCVLGRYVAEITDLGEKQPVSTPRMTRRQ